ncbi:glycosyltransferase family 2 protein [Actinomycetaceae bacterium L2_0104]
MENGQSLRIVTVAFNPGDELANLAASLPGATDAAYELVIVDNGTEYDVVDDVAREFDARVVRTGTNLGYGSAANRGLADATGEWAIVVNPDVVFGDGAIDAMLAATGDWPRGGAFGPLIRSEEGEIYPSARHFPRLTTGIGHAAFSRIWPANPFTRSYQRNSSVETAHTVDWLSGACLLLRLEAFRQVGGFDESYFMFFEDTQLGEQLKDAGWQSIFLPSAVISHAQGSSWKEKPASMLRAHHRSAARYLAGVYSASYQAPLRLMLRGGLWVRGELQVLLARLKSLKK